MSALTLADEMWLAKTLPFLMFGSQNVKEYASFPGKTECRKHFFQTIEYDVWLVHLTLLLSGDITKTESETMLKEFENYTSKYNNT